MIPSAPEQTSATTPSNQLLAVALPEPKIEDGIRALVIHWAYLNNWQWQQVPLLKNVVDMFDPVDDYPSGRVSVVKPPLMLIPDLIMRGGITIIYGPPKTGKTLVALRLAHCVATGSPFFGRKPKRPSGVLYISAEGYAINQRRLQALTVKDDNTFETLPLIHITASNLASPAGLDALDRAVYAVAYNVQRACGVQLGLIVIDTIAAGLSIEDENDNSKVSQALKRIEDVICRRHGIAVLLVHHSGKVKEAGARGASAFVASASVIANTAKISKGNFSFDIKENRIGESDYEFGRYTVEAKQFGEDEDGEPVSVAFIKMGKAEPVITKAKPGRPAKGVDVLPKAFAQAFDTKAMDWHVNGDPTKPRVKAVKFEDLLEAYMPLAEYSDEKDPKKERKNAIKSLNKALASMGHMFSHHGTSGEKMVWRIIDIKTDTGFGNIDMSMVIPNHQSHEMA